jgi:hypothetical protein
MGPLPSLGISGGHALKEADFPFGCNNSKKRASLKKLIVNPVLTCNYKLGHNFQ